MAGRMRREIPDYVDELPVVSATPETVEEVLRDLVRDPHRRRELGERGPRFALKWHSAAGRGAAHGQDLPRAPEWLSASG